MRLEEILTPPDLQQTQLRHLAAAHAGNPEAQAPGWSMVHNLHLMQAGRASKTEHYSKAGKEKKYCP